MLTGLRRAASFGLVTALFVLPALVAARSAISVTSAKASITSSDGSSDASYILKDNKGWGAPLVLPELSTLKVSLTVVDKDSGEGVVPSQAFITFDDPTEKIEDVVLQLNVRANGKATFSLPANKVPKLLAASTSGRWRARILLGNGDDVLPYLLPLGELNIPGSSLVEPLRTRHSLPPRAGEPAFQEQPELFHTFKVPEKPVLFAKAALSTVSVFTPWLILVGLIGSISGLNFKSPPLVMYVFLFCLVGLEGLIVRYWIGWRLYQLLPPFLGLSAVSAYIATVALRSARAERLKAGGTP